MSIEQQLQRLYSLERAGIRLGLEHTRELLRRCGDPQKTVRTIQIAGTNGKGSTAAFLASILRAHGRSVGLYTSPHLLRFNERIRVDGICISDGEIASWWGHNTVAISEVQATFFEVTTVLAMNHFSHHQVDVAILETGLGGRLDSTTACAAQLCAITPIALDHTEFLGGTLALIAGEKAGIMQPGGICFSAGQEPEVRQVLRAHAEALGVTLQMVGGVEGIPGRLNLAGAHQQGNAALAQALARAELGADFDAATSRAALQGTVWPGRFQRLQERPVVIFDVAHNPHGIAAVLQTMRSEIASGAGHLVLALQKGKDVQEVLSLLAGHFERIVLTETGIRQFLPAAELAAEMPDSAAEIDVENNPVAAIRTALQRTPPDDFLVIIGSHYLGPAVGKVFKITFDKLA